MAGFTNIQELFDLLQAIHVRGYLLRKGWQLVHADDTRWHFEGPFGENGEICRQWIFASEQDRRFRNRIPNVVFALSVMENRPALEVANDMFASKVSLPAEPGAAPAPLCIRNALAELLPVGLKSAAEPVFVLRPAEQLEIHPLGLPDGSWDLQFGAVLVVNAERAAIRFRESGEEAAESVRELVPQELAAAGYAAPAWWREVSLLVGRIDFELDEQPEAGDVRQNWVRRQAAILSVALARRLPADNAAQMAVWRIALRLLARAPLPLVVQGGAVSEFLKLAAADDEAAPRETLAWLKPRTGGSPGGTAEAEA